jgi:hypothetical protein
MAFDGAGTFLRLRSWIADATAGVKIRADFHDDEDNNLAAGLTNCITKDGQTTITQNLPMNSKRLTALADPVDPQDAATKAYADTKIAKAGDGAITGNLNVSGNLGVAGNINANGALDIAGVASAQGYKTRKGLPGPYGVDFFNFDWTNNNLDVWVDNTNIGTLATQAFANNAANSKLPLAGGVITGNLQVNGELLAAQNLIRFSYSGSPAYLLWQGAANYLLGGGGTIWHSGNFNPATITTGTVSNARLVFATDVILAQMPNMTMMEYAGAVLSGIEAYWAGGNPYLGGGRWRYLQIYTTSWFTVGFA